MGSQLRGCSVESLCIMMLHYVKKQKKQVLFENRDKVEKLQRCGSMEGKQKHIVHWYHSYKGCNLIANMTNRHESIF